MAGASIYLGAFSSTLVTKRSIGGNSKIHRDQLAPPPTSWKELIKHPYKSEILTATRLEFNHLMKETLEVDNEYKGHTVPLKWMRTYKFNSNGFLTKFKSRLCVRGDLQLPILQETYAATLAMKTFRAMMALMCAFNLESRQYNLVIAFCNAKLSAPMYCNTPPGFEYLGRTLKIERALYGLRESPLLWYRTLKQALRNFGYEDMPGVDCLMRGENTTLLIYLNDMILLFWPYDKCVAGKFESFLSSNFKMTSSEKIRVCLSQELYGQKLGIQFDLEGRKSYPKVPLPQGVVLCKNEGIATKSQIRGYQQKVGSIGHAAVSTRPDIAKAHAVLAQFLHNPSGKCIELADHLLSYLYGKRCYDMR
ncbi:hypothetical protein K3495_g11810 [Podosphaera aphanis]|nr:hypothetical protein K3495_g11810 [Podosphaera aphanis]